jgi:hypothetical protein
MPTQIITQCVRHESREENICCFLFLDDCWVEKIMLSFSDFALQTTTTVGPCQTKR